MPDLAALTWKAEDWLLGLRPEGTAAPPPTMHCPGGIVDNGIALYTTRATAGGGPPPSLIH